MRSFLLLLQGVLTILGIFALHTIVVYAAPYPLFELHTIYIFLIWLLIREQKTRALWLSLVFGYLTELYSSSYFGVQMISLMISVIITSWLIEKIFTNHAWYIIGVLGLCATITHHILYVLVSSAGNGYKTIGVFTSASALQELLIAMMVNTLGLLGLYLLSRLIGKRANPRYI